MSRKNVAFVSSPVDSSIITVYCRFLGLKKIGGSALKANVAAAIVVSIWIYNAGYNIPMLMYANQYIGRHGRLACFSKPDPNYSLASRIINFYVPLTITWMSNIGIIYKLKRTMNKAIQTHDLLMFFFFVVA